MYEITSVSINAVMVVFKTTTFLSLILGVVLIVFTELIKSMSELASFFVRTIPMIHVLFTELRLLFVKLGFSQTLA
jgi:hypothetical protein